MDSSRSNGESAQMRRDKKRAAAFKEGGNNKKKVSGHDAWTKQHTNIVRMSLLRAAFAGRASIYAAHGLKSRVDNHGCDRIGKKIQAELKAIAAGWGMSVTANDLKMPVGAETFDETLELLMERLESGGGPAGGNARRRVKQEKGSEGDE